MSESQDRRAFLKRSAAAVSAAAVGCRPGTNAAAADGAGGARALPTDVLRAVAGIVLPSELGAAGIERVTAAFEDWLAACEPVAEQVHGYGSQEIRYGPPDPAPRWRAQLDALEREARARHGAGFAELDETRRRGLLEAALADAGDDELPDRPGALRAEHIAVGLAGFFFGSPEGVNLCYRRRIDGGSCRPLSASAERPAELAAAPGGASPAAGELTPDRRLAVARHPPRDPGAAPERGLAPGS